MPSLISAQEKDENSKSSKNVFLKYSLDGEASNSNRRRKNLHKDNKYDDFIRTNYILALRGNLLHWITLTPDLGFEYRNYGLANLRIGILCHGAWMGWNTKLLNGSINFWKINPELRYYLGRKKQTYLGLAYTYLDYNVKFKQGYKGDSYIFSLTTGYQLRLDKKSNLFLDFNIGLGYANMLIQPYELNASGKTNNLGSPYIANYIGCTQLGISLIWAFVKEPL